MTGKACITAEILIVITTLLYLTSVTVAQPPMVSKPAPGTYTPPHATTRNRNSIRRRLSRNRMGMAFCREWLGNTVFASLAGPVQAYNRKNILHWC